MKKKLVALMLCIVALSGCGRSETKQEELPSESLMTVVDDTLGYTIYVHDETGVMYFSRDGGYGKSVCVMVDADGKPLIYHK